MTPIRIVAATAVAAMGFGLTAVMRVRAAAVPADDARLRQPVRMTGMRQRLHSELRELTQQSGVRLTADVALGRRGVILLASGQPLGGVMDQFAALLGTPPGSALWARGERDGKPTYRLTEDIVSRQARARLQERRYRLVKERFRQALELAEMSSEELAAHRSEHPRLAASPPRPLLRLVGSLPPEQLEATFRGGALRIPFSELGPRQQEIVKGMVSGRYFRSGRELPDGSIQEVQRFEGPRDYPKTSLEVGLAGSPDRPGVQAWIRLAHNNRQGSPNLIDPPVPAEDERPDWLKDALLKEKQDQQRARLAGPRPPKDPELLKRVTVRKMVKIPDRQPRAGETVYADLSLVVWQISEQTRLPVIADYDPGYYDYYDPKKGARVLPVDLVDVPLWQALDSIADLWDLRWEKKDGWLRVRSPRAVWAMLGRSTLVRLMSGRRTDRGHPERRAPAPTAPADRLQTTACVGARAATRGAGAAFSGGRMRRSQRRVVPEGEADPRR